MPESTEQLELLPDEPGIAGSFERNAARLLKIALRRDEIMMSALRYIMWRSEREHGAANNRQLDIVNAARKALKRIEEIS